MTIKTTRIKDEDCLLVQGILAGTPRQNDKSIFYIILWALCLLDSRVSLNNTKLMYLSRPADCHSWLGTQGLCPSFPQGSPAIWSLLPTLGQSWQLKITKTWEEGGEAERERRVCLYFLFMKWLTFSIPTLENPFVNYLNKSKQWSKRGDSRFPLGLPAFSSCHFSQDRISPFEAAVCCKFQSQGLFIITSTCPCPFVNPLLDAWMSFYEKDVRWHLPGSKVPESFQFDRSGLRPTKCWQPGYREHCHVQHGLVLMRFGQSPSSHREYQFHSNYFPQRMYTSFQTEIKMQRVNMHHTWSKVMRHLFACVLGGKRAYNQQGRLLHPKPSTVICSS